MALRNNISNCSNVPLARTKRGAPARLAASLCGAFRAAAVDLLDKPDDAFERSFAQEAVAQVEDVAPVFARVDALNHGVGDGGLGAVWWLSRLPRGRGPA